MIEASAVFLKWYLIDLNINKEDIDNIIFLLVEMLIYAIVIALWLSMVLTPRVIF